MTSQVKAKTAGHPIPLLTRWKMALDGCNVPQLEVADSITRWLVITRSCVFSMSFTSGLIGLLIAAEQGSANWVYGILATIGITVAHASNNILNDLGDFRNGLDTKEYPRGQYGPHALLDGLTTTRGLLTAALVFNLVDLAIMLYLFTVRGPLVIAFAVAGLVLSLSYTGFLKRAGLGELTAFLVWGPLMTAGTAYVASGTLTPAIWTLSIPYGIIVASVLMGKHIDKIPDDKRVGVNSVPVLLGEKRARRLNQASFVAFYLIIIAMVVFGFTGPWVLLTFLAFGRLRQAWDIYSKPMPEKKPDDWEGGPLWFVAWALFFNRQAGQYFTIGLLLNIATPYVLDLLNITSPIIVGLFS